MKTSAWYVLFALLVLASTVSSVAANHVVLGASTLAVEDYITDIDFAVGDDRGAECKEGYTKDWTDLNSSAGGKFIFLCYIKQAGKTPLTDIKFVASSSKVYDDACPGYQFLKQDLNQGAGGNFIHACIKKGGGDPITTFKLVSGKEAYKTQCNGFITRDTDLNQGAGGDYMYLCFKKEQGAIDRVRIYDMVYDMSKLTEGDKNVKEVSQIVVDNNDKNPSEPQTLKGRYEVTLEKSWEISNEVGAGLTVEITAGSPLIGVENKWKVSAEYKFTTTNGGSTSETEAKEFNFLCDAAPFTQTQCEAVYRTTKISVPYTAQAEYIYMDGTSKVQTIKGTYKGVAASSISMTKKVLKNYAYKLPVTDGVELASTPNGKMILKLIEDYRKLRDTIQCKGLTFENRCYMTINKRINMYDALSQCEGWGGKLASVQSASENEFIKSQCGGSKAWIGGFRNAQDKFVWFDETEMKYSNWATGMPTKAGSKQRLEAMVMLSSGQWIDADTLSTDAQCFVCKQ